MGSGEALAGAGVGARTAAFVVANRADDCPDGIALCATHVRKLVLGTIINPIRTERCTKRSDVRILLDGTGKISYYLHE
jgi:hypothetical protein